MNLAAFLLLYGEQRSAPALRFIAQTSTLKNTIRPSAGSLTLTGATSTVVNS
jgi:hypothetical protein